MKWIRIKCRKCGKEYIDVNVKIANQIKDYVCDKCKKK